MESTETNNNINNTNTTKNSNIILAVIGDQAVGKSSLLMQFVDKKFSLTMMGSAGVDCKKKVIDYKNNKIDLHFYDSAGHDRFRHIIEPFLKKCKGVILVYDVTDYDSFTNVNSWINSITQNTGPNIQYIILGNKIDLHDKKVSKEDAANLKAKYGVDVYEVSAKTGENVDNSIMKLVVNIIEKNGLIDNINNINKLDKQATEIIPVNKNESVKLSYNDKKTKNNSCCYMCG